MTEGPAAGKTVRFKDPEGYPCWADIIREGDVSGTWVVDYTESDEEGEALGQVELTILESDITWVEEYSSDGDKEFVVYGKVGMPTVREEVHGSVTIIESEFETGPEKLGEVCICADADGLRDLANFLNEQARVMDDLGADFDHAHYRSAHGIWPDIVVSKIHDQDRKEEE